MSDENSDQPIKKKFFTDEYFDDINLKESLKKYLEEKYHAKEEKYHVKNPQSVEKLPSSVQSLLSVDQIYGDLYGVSYPSKISENKTNDGYPTMWDDSFEQDLYFSFCNKIKSQQQHILDIDDDFLRFVKYNFHFQYLQLFIREVEYGIWKKYLHHSLHFDTSNLISDLDVIHSIIFLNASPDLFGLFAASNTPQLVLQYVFSIQLDQEIAVVLNNYPTSSIYHLKSQKVSPFASHGIQFSINNGISNPLVDKDSSLYNASIHTIPKENFELKGISTPLNTSNITYSGSSSFIPSNYYKVDYPKPSSPAYPAHDTDKKSESLEKKKKYDQNKQQKFNYIYKNKKK